MKIRPAGVEDVPAIVELLKVSLGEGLMPKSERYWRWKHLQNPFGESPVLLAFEGEMMIGVRAFMRWNWTNANGTVVRAVRAVDTATHPGFQGKGIFSTLTKNLLSACLEEGVDIVFNTPNEKSMPGYLKMGWQKAGRLPLSILVRRPLNCVRNVLVRKQKNDPPIGDGSVMDYLRRPDVDELIRRHRQMNGGVFVTQHTTTSLLWRYGEVPVATYFADGLDKNGLKVLYFYRLKESRFGVEMRITDLFLESKKMVDEARRMIRLKSKVHDVDFVSVEGISALGLLGGFSITSSFGPVVTVRKISMPDLSHFLNFFQWRPGTGDLELF